MKKDYPVKPIEQKKAKTGKSVRFSEEQQLKIARISIKNNVNESDVIRHAVDMLPEDL